MTAVELAVHAAVASVDDPEYPGISIVDLGLLETLDVTVDGTEATVAIGLIPTFSGCPALHIIASEVESAVAGLDAVDAVSVSWLSAPVWSVDRVSHDARSILAQEFTVGIAIGPKPAPCPRCGSPTVEQSLFGPTRCRSVHRCTLCHETVEVMRS